MQIKSLLKNQGERPLPKSCLSYCDMIAYMVKERLSEITNGFIVGQEVKMDLAEEGYMQSTTKWVSAVDNNGKQYKITVEEV